VKKIRILIADDHTLVRAGIRALLDSLPETEVVAEAGDGRDALRLIEQLRPDLILMDVAMSGMNGLEATGRISRDYPDSRVVILSMHANEEYVIRALRAGAAGYMLKDAAMSELEWAVKTVAAGQTYLSPAVARHVAEYVQRTGGDAAGSGNLPDPYERLTPRQREILQLIAEGATTQDIAHTLSVSVKTVETHRAQLMDRLDIHDVAGLVRYAIRAGLVAD
jgi:DNA-binding NarL/FixJ family response regulator